MINVFKNDMEGASGLGKVLHILSWPIRKFYIVIPVLALIYVTPVFFEVNPRKVHIWYKDKTVAIFQDIIATPFISKSIHKVQDVLGMEKTPLTGAKSVKVTPSENLVEMHKPRSKVRSRKTFSVADEVYKFEIEKDTSGKVVKEEYASAHEEEIDDDINEDVKEVPQVIKGKTVANINIERLPDSDTSRFKLNPNAKKLPLTYLENPKDIIGKATIVNANELEINGVHILLYGIYAHPLTPDGKKSEAYLVQATDGKDVKCSIVAYTNQKVATAVCFVGDENLNEKLIKLGITKNIAL